MWGPKDIAKIMSEDNLLEQDMDDAAEAAEQLAQDKQKEEIDRKQDEAEETTEDISQDYDRIIAKLSNIANKHPDGKHIKMFIDKLQDDKEDLKEPGSAAHDIIKTTIMSGD